MKKNIRFIILAIGLTGFLASCQCKTCKKTGDPSIQICKGDGTDEEYNNAIDGAVGIGYDCQ